MKAIVFIDVQNDFLKNGKLPFGYPVEDNLQKVVDFAKECVADSSCKIYATRDTHEKTLYHSLEHPLWQLLADHLHEKNAPGVDPTSGYLATLEGHKLPVEHCIEGTNGWQVATPLMDVILGYATFVNKPTFGSFDLADIINEDCESDLDEIVLVGYDAAICVISNALILRAKFPNVKITIKKSLCGCVSKDTFDAAMKVAATCQVDVE